MKLTESKLRSIIREELVKLTEITSDEIQDMIERLSQDLAKHPAVENSEITRAGGVSVTVDGREFRVSVRDEDPIDRAPTKADPENWRVKFRERVKGLGGYVNSRNFGERFSYPKMKEFVENSIEKVASRR